MRNAFEIYLNDYFSKFQGSLFTIVICSSQHWVHVSLKLLLLFFSCSTSSETDVLILYSDSLWR